MYCCKFPTKLTRLHFFVKHASNGSLVRLEVAVTSGTSSSSASSVAALLPAVPDAQLDNNEWKTTTHIPGCAGVHMYLLQQQGLRSPLGWTRRHCSIGLASAVGLASAGPSLPRVVEMRSQMLLQMQSGLVVRVYWVPVSLRNKHKIFVLATRIPMSPGVGGSGAAPCLRLYAEVPNGPPVIAAGSADSSSSGFSTCGSVSLAFFDPLGLLFGAIPSGMSKTLSSFVANSRTSPAESHLIFRFRIL